MPVTVTDAVILAAGNGDRFRNGNHHSKLLHPVAGQPLILRTLRTAANAGITSFCVVLGFEADRVRAMVEQHSIPGTTVRFVYNPDWHLENGVSALAARKHCGHGRFALLMGDHLFEAAVLERILSLDVDGRESVLAVDSLPAEPSMAAEATRVRMRAGCITAIGKDVEPWDALDTGLFVFSPLLFDALETAQAEGETTLSAGVQRLAAQGLMRGADVAGAAWCDVDTVDDLDAAESLVAAEPEHA
ncbi:MAG: NTP transferase domain-containing protein [Acidobacteria bacterium]|nr:NTP transferase domain-containing protein [Acidobacteriota bacterium]